MAGLASGITRVGLVWVLASVLCALLSLVVRALRWRLLLGGVKGFRVGSLVSATFIGVMANNLLPARLGEVVRAWVLARREQAPVPAVLASILVERLLDVIAALVLLGYCLTVTSELGDGTAVLLKRTGFVLLLMSVVGVASLLLTVRFQARLLLVGERWAVQTDRGWALRWLGLFRRFVGGLGGLRGGKHGVVVAGLSLLVWIVAIFSFQVLADGFALHLSLVQTTLVFVIVLFGVAIPSAPGFVGTFHGFCVAGLTLVAGTEPTVAAAYATLLHGSQWLASTVVGLGYFVADRSITWSGITELANRR